MPLTTWETTQQPMRTSSFRTLPLPDAAPSQQGIVSLGQVRCGPRAINEYVDSLRPQPVVPLKPHHLGFSTPLPSAPTTPVLPGHGHSVSLPCRTNQHQLSTTGGGVGGGGGEGEGHATNAGVGSGLGVVVSTQPSKSLPLKEEAGESKGGGGKEERHSSIICAQCGKCRCTACSESRELPVRWCCGDRYELSARKAVDVCTCFCCVQTVFYHYGPEEDNACYDDPCACGGSRCCARWACLAGSALLLPCLLCYCPMQGCLDASQACYNCCRKKGCQCSRQPPVDKTPSNFSQTRRLLVESESSSSST